MLLEPLEHSVLMAPREESDVSVTDVTDVAVLNPVEHSGVEMRVETMSACLPRVFSDHRVEDVSLLDVRPNGNSRRLGRPLLWVPSVRQHPGF